MAKRSIASVDVSGKKVLVRLDLNAPLENGVITDDRRLRESVPTIRSVIDRGGRAILASHLGRPEGGGYEAAYSLRPVAQHLSKLLGVPVAFPSNDCLDAAAAKGVQELKDGQVLLLENLRFHKGEKTGDAAFASKLAAYADVYCNDAFGACHRPDASMLALPKAMGSKPNVVGFLIEKELKYLDAAIKEPAKPFVVVLGGAKVSDKLPAIERFLPKADAVLVGGAMAYTFLKALGQSVGNSKVEEDRLKDAKRIIDLALKLKSKLMLPTDHVASTQFAKDAGEIGVYDESIPAGFMGLDIGPKTQAAYAAQLRKAKCVVWNGPMGVFEWPSFAVGTKTVARAIAEATKDGCTSIAGGGDTAAALAQFGLDGAFTHVSTGGGASLELLEGKAFESLAALDNA